MPYFVRASKHIHHFHTNHKYVFFPWTIHFVAVMYKISLLFPCFLLNHLEKFFIVYSFTLTNCTTNRVKEKLFEHFLHFDFRCANFISSFFLFLSLFLLWHTFPVKSICHLIKFSEFLAFGQLKPIFR